MGREGGIDVRGSHLAIALILIFGVISGIVRVRAARERSKERLQAVQETIVHLSKVTKRE